MNKWDLWKRFKCHCSWVIKNVYGLNQLMLKFNYFKIRFSLSSHWLFFPFLSNSNSILARFRLGVCSYFYSNLRIIFAWYFLNFKLVLAGYSSLFSLIFSKFCLKLKKITFECKSRRQMNKCNPKVAKMWRWPWFAE